MGGFGTGLGHVQVTQESSTSEHQGWHRQSPKFLCQVSSPAAAPKPRCLRFQPSQSCNIWSNPKKSCVLPSRKQGMGSGREGTLERGWEQGRRAGKAGWCGGKGCRKQLLGPRAPRPARVQLRGGFHGTPQLPLPLAAPKAVIKCGQTHNYRGAAAGGLWGSAGPLHLPGAACQGSCAVLPVLPAEQGRDQHLPMAPGRAGISVPVLPDRAGTKPPMLQTGQGSMSP